MGLVHCVASFHCLGFAGAAVSTQRGVAYFWHFDLCQTFVRRSSFNSCSGSCHGSDVTWQEIGCMCGSVCSCPHRGSQNAVPPFGFVQLPWSIWYFCQTPCLGILMPASWSHGYHEQSTLTYFVPTNWIDADFLWKISLLLSPPWFLATSHHYRGMKQKNWTSFTNLKKMFMGGWLLAEFMCERVDLGQVDCCPYPSNYQTSRRVAKLIESSVFVATKPNYHQQWVVFWWICWQGGSGIIYFELNKRKMSKEETSDENSIQVCFAKYMSIGVLCIVCSCVKVVCKCFDWMLSSLVTVAYIKFFKVA